jgi:hypothetical protein
MKIILIILIMVFLLPFILCLIDRFKGTHYSCSTFGWHNGSGGNNSFDGCSALATCSKCGKEVMQDSQGNWF